MARRLILTALTISEAMERMHYSDLLSLERFGQSIGIYKRMGIVFGDQVDGAFIRAQLPFGWARRGCADNPKLIRVLDGKERTRIAIRVEAHADQRTLISMFARTRYSFAVGPLGGFTDGWEGRQTLGVITDCGRVVFKHPALLPPMPNSGYQTDPAQRALQEAWWEQHFQLSDALHTMLSQMHPLWADPLAYWGN